MAKMNPRVIAQRMAGKGPQIVYRTNPRRPPVRANGRVYVGIDWLRETFPGPHGAATFSDKRIEITWDELEQSLTNGPLLDHLLASLMGRNKL